MRLEPEWGKERVSVERLPDMNQNPKGREGIHGEGMPEPLKGRGVQVASGKMGRQNLGGRGAWPLEGKAYYGV